MPESKTPNIWENDPEDIESEHVNNPVEMTTEEAMQLVDDSLLQIEHRGWVLWRLRNVMNSQGIPRKICLLRDYTVKGYPPGYPLFSLEEFEKLPDDISPKTMNLLVHVKVKSDARLDSVEDNKDDWGTV